MLVQREVGKLSKNKLWYLGGIIDGEGYIGIIKNDASKIKYARTPYYYNSVVKVASVDEILIDILLKYFGGYKSKRVFKGNRRDAWMWEIKNSLQVAYFLKKITKTLILKKAQAEIVLEYMDWKINKRKRHNKQGCKPYTKEDLEISENYYQQMRKLNKRGRRPAETK